MCCFGRTSQRQHCLHANIEPSHVERLKHDLRRVLSVLRASPRATGCSETQAARTATKAGAAPKRGSRASGKPGMLARMTVMRLASGAFSGGSVSRKKWSSGSHRRYLQTLHTARVAPERLTGTSHSSHSSHSQRVPPRAKAAVLQGKPWHLEWCAGPAHLKMHCCQYRSMWSQFSTWPCLIGQCTVYWLEFASACIIKSGGQLYQNILRLGQGFEAQAHTSFPMWKSRSSSTLFLLPGMCPSFTPMHVGTR